MTYHLQKSSVPLNRGMKVDSQKLFPEKLYDIVNDDYLFRWADGGTWISVVDENAFENEVMKRYPGFLQIPSFMNLRRLFREYSFEWRVNEETSQYEFHHPCFVRGKPDLLSEIKTRRKGSTPVGGGTGRRRRTGSNAENFSPRTRCAVKRGCEQLPCQKVTQIIRVPMTMGTPVRGQNGTTTTQLDADSTSSFSPAELSNDQTDLKMKPERKDFSELKYTYWRNESDRYPFYNGLPPEVWAQAPMPVCPTPAAVQQSNSKTHNAGSYQMLVPTQYQTPKADSQSVEQMDDGEENVSPSMGWGWAPMPYYYPYPGHPAAEEMYQSVPQPSWQHQQGQGGGDIGVSLSKTPLKVPQMYPVPVPGAPQMWGYPYPPAPWGCPPAFVESQPQPSEDPTQQNINQSDSNSLPDLKPQQEQAAQSPQAV